MAELEIHSGDSATTVEHSGDRTTPDDLPGVDVPDSIAVPSQTETPAAADHPSLPESDPPPVESPATEGVDSVPAQETLEKEGLISGEALEENLETRVCKEDVPVEETVKDENEVLENGNVPAQEAVKPSDDLVVVPSEEISGEKAEIKIETIETEAISVEKHEEERENGSVEGSEAQSDINGVVVSENGTGDEKREAEIEKVEKVEKEPEKEQEKELVKEEYELMDIPSHWQPKPGIRVTIIGGSTTEEELTSLFNTYGTISSIAFETDRRDAAILRFDSLPGDELPLAKIQENINNTQLGSRTLRVEAFKTDSLLFVGNLTSDIDDKALKNMFEPLGRVERAFVLRNLAGKTKGYGFVEYSLKSEAVAAKASMNMLMMDGRILRVELSYCKSIKDMFSSVLFVDRITRHMPNTEASLKTLFGQYAEVTDIHLAIGMGGVSRGFAFIDFSNSASADKAREALDGREFGGLNLRISFANPSKSAQSYKQRLAQGVPPMFGTLGRGAVAAMQTPRGSTYMPYGGNQLTGAGRPTAPGMGLEMQFNRGSSFGPRARGQSVMARGSGIFDGAPRMGMIGRAAISDNNIHQRPGVPVGSGPIPRFLSHGAQSVTTGAIGQVAVQQVKAYEDEARARGEDHHRQVPTQQMAFDQSKQPQSQYPYRQQYQQQQPQQSYQPQQAIQQQFYQQSPQIYQQQPQQTSTLQSQYQSPQQNSQYYAQAADSYPHPQQHQPSQQQSSAYYQQQATTQEQLYSSNPQYSQQFNQPYAQTAMQQYSQTSTPSSVMNNTQSYQQTQPEVPYSQPTYSDQQYAQNQPQNLSYQRITQSTPTGTFPSSQDSTQQQAYDAYYQQQQTGQVATGGSQAHGTQPQGQDAQWAAYYASQAAYQQQTQSYNQAQQQQPPLTTIPAFPEQSVMSGGAVPIAGVDIGQKRAFDQMDGAQQSQQTSYPVYQQPPSYQNSTYQQAAPAAYSQQMASAYPQQQQQQQQQQAYQNPVYADGYYQQQQPSGFPPAVPAAAQVYDYSKRPRF